jgi:serine/threonine protein kinase
MSTLIFDHRKVLGEGDYGTVFEGKWRGIPVAVKRVPHQCLNSGNERELKALQSLNHPNVIKLLHSESVEYFR